MFRRAHLPFALFGRTLPRKSLLAPSHTTRGAKTKSTIKFHHLPQGALAPLPLPSLEDDAESQVQVYPRVIQQHLNNVNKFSDCVVLTRIGNFYELYGEQAEQYAPLLNLKVAQRKTGLGPVAMAGFQFTQLDRFLKSLVQGLNKHVAISEEVKNSPADQVKNGGLLYNRKRFSIGKGDADDLLALAKTIQIISQIVDMTTGPLSIRTNSSSTISSLRALIGRLDLAGPLKLADRILEAIDEDGLSQQHLAEEAEAVGVAELAEQIAEAEEPQTRSTKRGKSSTKKPAVVTDLNAGEYWIMRKRQVHHEAR
ncbi:hypothetical protein VTO58DRAFT_106658 [Aureobasidium pullulans]